MKKLQQLINRLFYSQVKGITFFETRYHKNIGLKVPKNRNKIIDDYIKERLQESKTKLHLYPIPVNGFREIPLTEIPEQVFEIYTLKEFSIGRNDDGFKPMCGYWHGIKEISSKIGQLKSLEVLNLSHNLIKELPDEIGELTKLKKLNLHQNNLEKLPESIGNLIQLQELLIGGNYLRELPNSLRKLINLKKLSIFGNGLKSIPNQVFDLQSLEKLEYYGGMWDSELEFDNPNSLEEFPIELLNMKKLIEIDLSGLNFDFNIPKNIKFKIIKYD